MKTKLTRATAAAIAKDLVEGGIKAHGTTKITAQSHGVSIGTVRKIRNVLLRGNFVWNAAKHHCSAPEEYYRNFCLHLCSQVDAIENGWEDSALGIHEPL